MYQGLARNTCNVSEVGSIPTGSTMSYSDKFKVFWLNPMRTATRSCMQIQKKLEFEECGVHSFVIPEDKMDYQIIVNVRNPYSRLVSLYKLECIWKKKEFNIDSYGDWVRFVLQDRYIQNNIMTLYLDHLIEKLPSTPKTFIKLENLESDLKNIWFIEDNFDDIQEVFQNQILRNNYKMEYKISLNWKEFYDEELAELVYNKTKTQFEMFNYEKDSWKDGTS